MNFKSNGYSLDLYPYIVHVKVKNNAFNGSINLFFFCL